MDITNVDLRTIVGRAEKENWTRSQIAVAVRSHIAGEVEAAEPESVLDLEQEARIRALKEVRSILTIQTLLNGSTVPDADELVYVANYILTGDTIMDRGIEVEDPRGGIELPEAVLRQFSGTGVDSDGNPQD